jgi:hypothetical protein
MSRSTISRVRLRDPARLGRADAAAAGDAGPDRDGASPRRPCTDATSIGAGTPQRPRRTGSRPEEGDPVEPLI